jgi:hypothetical protein
MAKSANLQSSSPGAGRRLIPVVRRRRYRKISGWAALGILIAALEPSGKSSEGSPRRQPPFKNVIIPGKAVGGIVPDSCHSDLERLFGAKNVRRSLVYVGEGETVSGSTVFESDSVYSLEIAWRDGSRGCHPSEILVRGSGWQTTEGLHAGLRLIEVERLNGKPFSISGFGWDYGGGIWSWNGGRLGAYSPRNIHPFFEDPDASNEKPAYPALIGDREIATTDPALRSANPTLSLIRVGF